MNDLSSTDHQREDVARRIRSLISMRGLTQRAFAQSLGIDPANLSKHLSGRLPITDGLVNRIVADAGVSKRWLLTGAGDPHSKSGMADYVGADGSTLDAALSSGTPIYDIDVAAGCTRLSAEFTADRIIGHISLPRLRRDSAIVRVSGDSMVPVINPGAYIAINPDTDARNILWGQIYVIVMEDFRLVKYVRKGDTPDTVRLLSANPDYDEMTVERRDILALYLVEAIINYDLRC